MYELFNKRLIKYILLVLAVILILILPLTLIFSSAISVFDDALEGLGKYNGIRLPIVMYHGTIPKSKDLGKFVITPKELESDIKYLKDHGYTSITMTDLINYVYNDGELPSKPVMLTFDDGYYNNYIYATPILKNYNMKAVISVVGEFTEASTKIPENNVQYSYVTWEQIKNMNDSGIYEIQNHTYNLHKYNKNRLGAKKNKNESIEAYKDLLLSDVGLLQQKLKELAGVEPNTFTYPFGYICNDSIPILKEMGFKATLTCAEGVNIINKNKKDILFGLKRKNRPHGVSTESFFKNFCP
ncbi:polysaccharide deacetylase family protein [Ruminiclostridium josui]|uniref:polysaccharide deacetylase family protein n=1 Tax=Ruminiclostridium josui TaxID=1499 RepID=UPI000463DAB4|nr:polysaccharide deacetylase family protein [Ruminiclostridium josui]